MRNKVVGREVFRKARKMIFVRRRVRLCPEGRSRYLYAVEGACETARVGPDP